MLYFYIILLTLKILNCVGMILSQSLKFILRFAQQHLNLILIPFQFLVIHPPGLQIFTIILDFHCVIMVLIL